MICCGSVWAGLGWGSWSEQRPGKASPNGELGGQKDGLELSRGAGQAEGKVPTKGRACVGC